MFAVVDHELGHAAVDADVFPCNKSRLIRAQKQHHIGNVHGIAYPAHGLLSGIGAPLADEVFAPYSVCSRSQVIEFLYKTYN